VIAGKSVGAGRRRDRHCDIAKCRQKREGAGSNIVVDIRKDEKTIVEVLSLQVGVL
jgi:hypothetical protein